MAALLDQDAFDKYEAWKAAKLAGVHDFSPLAYNDELRAQSTAFQAGARKLYQKARLWEEPKRTFVLDDPYSGEEFEVS